MRNALMGQLVEIHQTYEMTEALCVKSYLDAQGFYSLIMNEHHIVMSSGILSDALGGFCLLVSSEDAVEVTELLRAANRGDFSLDDDFDEAAIFTPWGELHRNG